MSEPTAYRLGVGIVLADAMGRVFVARRIDTPDAWQMPQGGIDAEEDPRMAALRELEEEIGTAAAVIVAETPGWLTYDLPPHLLGKVWGGRYRGQKQKWFLMRFVGGDGDIRLDAHDPEFDDWRWVAPDQVVELIVPFKRDVYAQVMAAFRPLLWTS